MTAIELRAELFREMNPLLDNESAMTKMLAFVKTLAAKKTVLFVYKMGSYALCAGRKGHEDTCPRGTWYAVRQVCQVPVPLTLCSV